MAPGPVALAECGRWAAVLACSAATGELPLVGLKLLHDLVHVLYCHGQPELQVCNSTSRCLVEGTS